MRTWLLENSGRAIDLFRQLDINGDGQIIKAEFTAALPLLGFDDSKAWVLEELFDRLDENGNGSLEYEEMHHQLRRDDIVLREDLRAGAVEFETEAKNFYELRGYDGSLKKEPTGLRRAPPRAQPRRSPPRLGRGDDAATVSVVPPKDEATKELEDRLERCRADLARGRETQRRLEFGVTINLINGG